MTSQPSGLLPTRGPRDERGAVITAIVLVMLPVLVVCVGLVVDTGIGRVTRSQISIALDTAARAGAAQLDRATGSGTPTVDRDAGPAVTASYYQRNRPSGLVCGAGESNVDLPTRGCWQRITVTLTQQPNGTARLEVTVIETARTVGLSSWLGHTEQSYRVTAVALIGNSGT